MPADLFAHLEGSSPWQGEAKLPLSRHRPLTPKPDVVLLSAGSPKRVAIPFLGCSALRLTFFFAFCPCLFARLFPKFNRPPRTFNLHATSPLSPSPVAIYPPTRPSFSRTRRKKQQNNFIIMSTTSVSDLYNFYSETLHDPPPVAASRTDSVDMPALSALSNLLLKTHPDGGAHSEPSNLSAPNGQPGDDQLSARRDFAHHSSETSEQDSPISDDRDIIDPDPTMRFPPTTHSQLLRRPTLPNSGVSQGVEGGHATTAADIRPNSNPTDANPTSPSSPTLSAVQKAVGYPVTSTANASSGLGDMSRSIVSRAGQMPAPGSIPATAATSNSSMPSRSRSNSSAVSPGSYFAGPPPAGSSSSSSYMHSNPVSRSNSNAKGHSPYGPARDLPSLPPQQQQQLSHSLTPRQSPTSSPKPSSAVPPAAPAPPTSTTVSSNGLPYSQPIPRPHRSRNDALHSLHRGSSLSGGSHSSPPSSHFSRSSGSPPIPSTATTTTTRKSAASRQSGLRSSIVSEEMQWEDGDHVNDGAFCVRVYFESFSADLDNS